MKYTQINDLVQMILHYHKKIQQKYPRIQAWKNKQIVVKNRSIKGIDTSGERSEKDGEIGRDKRIQSKNGRSEGESQLICKYQMDGRRKLWDNKMSKENDKKKQEKNY